MSTVQFDTLEYVCGDAGFRGRRRLVVKADGTLVAELTEGAAAQTWQAKWGESELQTLQRELDAASLPTREPKRTTGVPGEVTFTIRLAHGGAVVERTYWWRERNDSDELFALVERIQSGLRFASQNHIEW